MRPTSPTRRARSSSTSTTRPGTTSCSRPSACRATILPEVRSSSEVYAETVPDLLGGPVPIAGVAGDQQAALFGQACLRTGMAKYTYGTGCFLLMNTGAQPDPLAARAPHLAGLAARAARPTTAWRAASSWAAPRCSGCATGSGIIRSSAEIEGLAASVPDSGGIVLVPAFTGLGAPHWDPYARGALVGITRGTTAAHLARAALEGIAHQVADVLAAMEARCGGRGLRAAGGRRRRGQRSPDAAPGRPGGVPVARPTCARPPPSEPPTSPAWRSESGRAPRTWPATGRWNGSSSPPTDRAAKAAEMRALWAKAVERAKRLGDESRDDCSRPPRDRALGLPRRRRRRHRAGHGGRGGVAGLPDAPPRAARLRQGDVQPQHQADPWRRALPPAGQRLAGPRSPPRARAAAAERSASGPQPLLRRPGLRLVGGPVLRRRAQALRPARRPAGPGAVAASCPARRRWSSSPPWSPRGCAAASSTTTASSTTPAWPSPCCARSLDLGGVAAQLHARGLGLLKENGLVRGVRGAGRGDRRGARDPRPGGGQRHRRLRRRPAADGRAGERADPRPEPGDPPRARPLVPARRRARSWSRTRTTAASSSPSPGTAGSIVGTTDTPVVRALAGAARRCRRRSSSS